MADQAVGNGRHAEAAVLQLRPYASTPGLPEPGTAEDGIDRATAAAYAQAFKCLADPTRVLLLNRLARAGRALLVGEIVAIMDVGQSTVSHHLRMLLEGGFVRVRRSGTTSAFEVNPECLARFPATAAVIMNEAPVGVAACACENQGEGPIGNPADSPWCECHDGDGACDTSTCSGCDCGEQ